MRLRKDLRLYRDRWHINKLTTWWQETKSHRGHEGLPQTANYTCQLAAARGKICVAITKARITEVRYRSSWFILWVSGKVVPNVDPSDSCGNFAHLTTKVNLLLVKEEQLGSRLPRSCSSTLVRVVGQSGCTRFHPNPSNSCWSICVKAKKTGFKRKRGYQTQKDLSSWHHESDTLTRTFEQCFL